MLEAVTPDDMRDVSRKLVEMALEGDLKAIDLLLNRTLGKADCEPLVAIQTNVTSQSPTHDRERVGDIIERLRAERGDAPAEPEARTILAQKLADLDRRIARLNP